jgi:hypothetical protein
MGSSQSVYVLINEEMESCLVQEIASTVLYEVILVSSIIESRVRRALEDDAMKLTLGAEDLHAPQDYARRVR